ncbi:MAG: DUF3187 family protein [Thermoanaerobaculia bacterium]
MPARLLAWALLVLAGDGGAQPVDGTLSIPGARSVYVLDVPFLHFGSLDVSAPHPGGMTFEFGVAYGNTFSHTWHAQAIHNETGRNGLGFSRDEAETLHSRHGEDFIAFVDAEVTRLALRVTWGLTDHLSAALELPYVSFSALKLDSTAESFHRAFGLYDAERGSFPRNQYLVVRQRPFGALEYDDRQPAAGLSDVVATLRYRGETGGVRLSADLALKAPTGNADELRGSGSFDAGVLVGALYRFGERQRFGLRAEAGLVVPGRYRGERPVRLDVAAFGRLLAAADVRIGKRTSLSASAVWEQSPFRRDSVGDEAVTSVGLTVGLTRRFGEHVVAGLAFLENLPHSGDDTDFSFSLSIRVMP